MEKACIVGIGESDRYKWGASPKSEFHLAIEAITRALDDAGLKPTDVDGFASYSDDRNRPSGIATALGIQHVNHTSLSFGGGGGGSIVAFRNAVSAVTSGMAKYVIVYRSLAQGQFGRFGQAGGFYGKGKSIGEQYPFVPSAEDSLVGPYVSAFGCVAPSHAEALYAQRYMYRYGITREHLGHVAVTLRTHAQMNPQAMTYGRPITLEDHRISPMIADPLSKLDCSLENDAAGAVILTTESRARDLRQKPVRIESIAQDMGTGRATIHGLPEDEYTEVNYTHLGEILFGETGLSPKDVDVAEIYEGFTFQILVAMEDFGFCGRGEGGEFVAAGNILGPSGSIPVNTHGGNLSDVYIHGLTHPMEGARQIRGTSTCQIENAKVCLVTSGATGAPIGAMLLTA